MAHSSWKNAAKRKTHKERSQPAARRKFGLLEKHKDYVLRAKDFHKKERTIKTLQRKADERNPDEFYFAMEKARTKAGVHDGNLHKGSKYTQEQLKLMATQDVKYLAMREKIEGEKVRRASESLHYIGLAPQNKHTVFVEDPSEVKEFDAAKYFDTPAELVGRQYNRPRKEQLQQEGLVAGAQQPTKAVRKAERKKLIAYKLLKQREERKEKIGSLAAKLAYQKEVAHSKGHKRKLKPQELAAAVVAADQEEEEGGRKGQQGKAVFRWKRERKK